MVLLLSIATVLFSFSLLVIPSSSLQVVRPSLANKRVLSPIAFRRTSSLFSTALPQKVHECQQCGETFQSRNALFRHIRDTHEEVPDVEVLSSSVVIRYGYIINDQSNDNNDSSINEFVADTIHSSFQQCLSEFLQAHECIAEEMLTTAITYSSAAKTRQPSLRQDAEVIGATSEVLSFNFKLGCKGAVIQKWRDYASSGQLHDDMQSFIEMEGMNVQLHSLDALVPRSKKFYAERGCSQRSYRFILPLNWLMYGESGNILNDDELGEVRDWWRMMIARSESSQPHKHQNRRNKENIKPPAFIKRLKRSLKAAESDTIPNRRLRRQKAYAVDGEDSIEDVTSTTELDTNGRAFRLSQGRFGQLWRKERKCWSNFCHPSLKGLEASPGHEAVWRTIDKAKIAGFINHKIYIDDEDATQNMHAILELSGDSFVVGQIPRIISSIVAMTNGWLSGSFFEYTTRPDVYLPGPSMVPFLRNRMYFHTARYHFHELTAIGSSQISDQPDPVNVGAMEEVMWEVTLRDKLLKETPSDNNKVEQEWLLQLQNECKNIQREVEQLSADADSKSVQPIDTILQEAELNELGPVPDETYGTVLNQLRDIVSSKSWPATSGARSKVIKASGSSENKLTSKKGSVGSAFPGVSSGSFTIVNDELLGENSGIPIPHANSLFPDLVKVVFELERRIINENEAPLAGAEGMQRISPHTKRLPSTHCAVNRNAQFTPHVDSGRGQGQSVSMIVGLGDYVGGETLVEGIPYGIRYNPLEFNGWKQLHWTAPFLGERFSLVFFTPAMTLAEGADDDLNEDHHAANLSGIHSRGMSSILKPMQFRPDSTDALVIMEILSEKSAYELKSNAEIQHFTLENHACVLDIGAHIGVFSRVMISKGCKHIIAYEPEPSNFDLLTKNLETEDASSAIVIELNSEAVAHGPPQLRKLVRARNQNDGTKNTWRHSLEEYSQYNDIDKAKELPSPTQKNVLERFDVTSTPFFDGALLRGVTLVKMDCEGAEIDILLSDEAAKPECWMDTTDLVIEWSFTKERRVSVFHQAIKNLKEAGFTVYYEGLGSWWDMDLGALWPYPNDIIIFAHKS